MAHVVRVQHWTLVIVGIYSTSKWDAGVVVVAIRVVLVPAVVVPGIVVILAVIIILSVIVIRR